jgi:hypothetical protein
MRRFAESVKMGEQNEGAQKQSVKIDRQISRGDSPSYGKFPEEKSSPLET